ncbi:DUF411 domain-containing protein [Colwellia sp. MSW7]|uniref:DUF411 domain-containing protein n=1 Tax=Colwellia maritima TaxID=2912588 RepID=A0ABS9WZW4_9GAMM|nr:DUF411 domain-containing protein [Colwellia maritima]MCI2283504.1 DUF411 domain-containing protein [Colwellia maritima]
MLLTKYFVKILATVTLVTLILDCSDNEAVIAEKATAKAQAIMLDVYKSPTCGCCKEWNSHIDDNSFQSKAHNQNDISIIKEKHGIEPCYRSCHTAISNDGYAFEGHVLAKIIQQFLQEQHSDDVIGLSVLTMSLGSLGMEVDDKFHPYKVLSLKTDGSDEVYASVQTSQEQFE